jgi:hypothetical protein
MASGQEQMTLGRTVFERLSVLIEDLREAHCAACRSRRAKSGAVTV